MFITRQVEFSAAHTCWNPALTEEENKTLYGEEAHPRGHGHNYVLEVTLEGDPDAVTGMVVDLKDVKRILNEQVVEPMDHRHLNHETPPFDRVTPSTENLAIEIWRRLRPHFTYPARLANVRLFETTDFYVDYRGE